MTAILGQLSSGRVFQREKADVRLTWKLWRTERRWRPPRQGCSTGRGSRTLDGIESLDPPPVATMTAIMHRMAENNASKHCMNVT